MNWLKLMTEWKMSDWENDKRNEWNKNLTNGWIK